MNHRRRNLFILLGLCLWLPVTGVLALFLAGAVAFPIVEPYYGTRIVASLGLMAIVYGIESILGLGVIETCGFLSGNCSTHNLYAYAIRIWQGLVGVGLLALLCWLLLLQHRRTHESKKK